MADEELKKAFQELQFKTNETRGRITQGETLKKAHIQSARISEITGKALVDVSDELPVYRSVGRMFLLSSKGDEIKRYEQEVKDFKEKVEAIDKQKEYLERGMEESERNLREMVQARRG